MQIQIRPLQIEDAKTSYKWRNNPEVWKYTGSKPDRVITEEIEIQWLSRVLQNKNERRFAILVDDVYIGNTQLLNITQEDADFHIFIGDTNYWGKGIGNEVINLVIKEARLLKLNKIKLNVNKNNIAAYKLYLKNSFIIKKTNKKTITMELYLDYE